MTWKRAPRDPRLGDDQGRRRVVVPTTHAGIVELCGWAALAVAKGMLSDGEARSITQLCDRLALSLDAIEAASLRAEIAALKAAQAPADG